MNKKLKSIVSVLTALVIALSFTACKKTDTDNNSDKTSKTEASADKAKESNADKAKKAAEEFLDAVSEFKFKDASELIDNNDVFEEAKDVNSFDELIEVALKESDTDLGELEQYGLDADFFKNMLKKSLGLYKMKYEIGDEKETDDNTVEVEYKIAIDIPDMDILSDPATKYADEMQKYAESLASSVSANPTDAEKKEIISKTITHVYDLAFEDMKDSVDTKDIKGTLVLEENDGEWIISESDSDVDKLLEEWLGSFDQ